MKRFGKKVGGVKTPTIETSRKQSKTTGSPKKVGGVKVVRGFGTSKQMESCPENCAGEYLDGYWIHSRTCRWAAVLWNAHGYTAEDWICPYDCPPLALPSGWTHQPMCEFWERTGRTPFDHNAPREAEREISVSSGNNGDDDTRGDTRGSTNVSADSVTQSKARVRRGLTTEIDGRVVIPPDSGSQQRAAWEKFPDALNEPDPDDDLPF